MELIQDIVAIIAIIIGTLFSIVGLIGLIRFPDIYARLHATGKIGIFGAVLILVAAGTQIPVGLGKVIILIVSLMVTGPVGAHAISSAAIRIGMPLMKKKKNI